jgi:paraquat-inducible protein A
MTRAVARSTPWSRCSLAPVFSLFVVLFGAQLNTGSATGVRCGRAEPWPAGSCWNFEGYPLVPWLFPVTIACPDCGALEHIPPLPPRSKAVCRRCEGDLEKTSGRSITAALACSLGTWILLFPSNILPLLRVNVFGMQAQTSIAGGVAALWRNGWIVIAGTSAILVIGLPFIRFGLLSAALAAVRFGRRPRWLGPAFRWAMWLNLWTMSDVFLLASFVGYYRLINLGHADVSVLRGGWCFMAAGFLTMLSRATLDQRTVWRAIGPEVEVAPGSKTISCTTCDLVQPFSREGRACPRCGARLQARKSDALSRTTALVAAALIFFFPANILPMSVSTHLGSRAAYTIFTGVSDLFDAGIWPLGVLIFCTSILIPVLKIVAIGWCVLSVRTRSRSHLVAKTKIFRLVAELGRWSKTDPFTIVFFVPLVKFGGLASANAGWGATAFMMMSLLTMVASNTFDPRLMWDAALSRPT